MRKSIGDGRLLRASPRVFYISGCVQDASPRAALASEASAFVSKPFTPELLTDRVREIRATAEAELFELDRLGPHDLYDRFR